MNEPSVKSLVPVVGTLVVFLALTGVWGCSGDTASDEQEAVEATTAEEAEAGGAVGFAAFQYSDNSMYFQGCSDGTNRTVACTEDDGTFSCSCELGDEVQGTFELTEHPYDTEAGMADVRNQAIALAKDQCGFDLEW